jgi:dCTP diphosphatase
MNIEKIQRKLQTFSEDRGWDKFHTPQSLSIALSVEVSELLEIFQWSKSRGVEEVSDIQKKAKIEDEVADIYIYLLILSQKLKLDIEQVLNKKIEKNRGKYPIENMCGHLKGNEKI